MGRWGYRKRHLLPPPDFNAPANRPHLSHKDIEEIVEVLHWNDDGSAVIRCPGEHMHHHDKGSPPMLWMSPVPHVWCFHQSCKSEIRSLNHELAAMFSNCEDMSEVKPDPAIVALRKRLAKVRHLARIRVRGKLPIVGIEQWLAQSPYPVADVPPEQQFPLWMKALFDPEDLVWTGEIHESGEFCTINFKTAKEWIERGRPYGQQASVFTFKPEVLETGLRNMRTARLRRLLVLESDILTIEQFGGVVRWMQKITTLRSIVMTAGKGIHAAFDPPTFKPKLNFNGVDYVPLVFRGREYWPNRIDGRTWEDEEKRLFGDRLTAAKKTHGYWDAWVKWCRNQLDRNDNRRLLEAIKYDKKAMTEYTEADHKRNFRKRILHAQDDAARLQAHWKLLELFAILEGLGCDRQMLFHNLTTRCPGQERLEDEGRPTGRIQRLIYLDSVYPL